MSPISTNKPQAPVSVPNVIYDQDRYVLTVVRMAGIQPFKVKGTVTVNGLAVTAIRNPDTIYQ